MAIKTVRLLVEVLEIIVKYILQFHLTVYQI